MVTEGWNTQRLGDVVEFQRGFDLPNQYRVHGNIPIVSSGGVSGFHNEGKVLPPGIVTGRYGSIGQVFFLEQEFWPLNTALWVKDFHNNDPKFIYFLLSAFDFKKFSDKTGVPGVNRNDLHSVKVKVPPPSEQKKIAQILSTWDKAITTTEQLLANSQQQKKALMQQLLTGQLRLPGDTSKFQRLKFSDLLDIDDRNLGRSTADEYEFRYISLSDVSKGKIADKLEIHRFGSAPSRARRLVSEGDILLATVRPNLQGFCKVDAAHDGCVASTGFSALSPKKSTCGDYVYHYLFGAHVTGQINALVVGTNYPAINSSDVANLYIYCPEYREQQRIANILNACDHEINQLGNSLRSLRCEKKALMQQLLTGKRRVTINEQAA